VKRQFAVHHDGATPDGRFCTAIHAFPPINRAQPTQSLRRALSAHKPVLLSHFFHVVNACRFIWKLFKEVFCCHNHHIFSKPQAPLRNLFMFYIQTDIHFKSLKNISIYLLIPFTLAVLLPALYLNGIDDGTHEWEIIAVFSISYIFVIQALRRRDFINRKSFTLIIACVLFFVIGDTLFGFDLYHNMPYVYEISNIFYFLAQYVLIYSVQAQYFEKPELKKYVDERKTNSKKEENMHLR
jgi:hypothetical protein